VTEIPFFILNIKDIEIACFERMYANLKSFDVTFVFKDYENHIRVNSIPIKEVERVKDFLDDHSIIFYDVGKSMNWGQFLTNIRFDFKKFVADGAWTAWDSDDD
jgi:nucleosome binding factor SPN SPT16 subunit